MQPALGSREEKRAFYKMTFRITLPIALQNLMDACVNSADVVMLALVGQNELSASSLAGQVAFVLNMLLFGIASGASVLAAQYWGKGDRRTIERVMAISLRLSVAIGLLFTLAAAFAPGSIMRIFTNKPELIEAGSKYLVALSPSYVLSAFATLYLAVMRSVERVNMSAIVHGTAVLMNVALNACFIFGWGPFPKLGIVGVALATTITRACEALYCLLDTTVICKTVKLRVKDFFARHAALIKLGCRAAIEPMTTLSAPQSRRSAICSWARIDPPTMIGKLTASATRRTVWHVMRWLSGEGNASKR